MANETYQQEVNNWRAECNANIRKENGWLVLAGLSWLKPGKNQIGSDPKCEVQLPERLPASVGYLEYNGRTVTLRVNAGQQVKVNDALVDFAVLQSDVADHPSFFTLKDVCFVVIERGHKMGVRVWDNRREGRKTLPARTWFDIDESFRLPATYTAYDRPKKALMIISKTAAMNGDFAFNVNSNLRKHLYQRLWNPEFAIPQ